MRSALVLFVSVLILSFSASLSAKKTRTKQGVKTQDDAYAWLNKYGYNPCLNANVQCSLSFSSLLKEYQTRFGLKITGKLDEQTKQHMNRPRCGNEDKAPAALNAPGQLGQRKWSRSSLTYSLRGYPTEISEPRATAIIREAFNAWLDHIPLKIEAVCSTCNADFVIEFARQAHSDRYPFDGVGGTLAHAFFPEDGRVHFDKDEKWTESFTDDNTNLYLVAVHEIGHALGLDHTYNTKSIMYPSYQPMAKSSILPQPDREAIQKVYGSKGSGATTSSTRSTTTTKSTTTTTTIRRISTATQSSSISTPTGGSHSRCRLFIDAAFLHPDGTFHTLNAGILWRYLIDEEQWESRPSSYKSYYRNLPDALVAGAYDKRSRMLYFFSKTSVYTYEIDSNNRANYHGQQRLPRNLQNSIVGAIYYRGQIYVITPKTIRLYQTTSSFLRRDDNDLDEEFAGFTGNVKTAFSYGDLHHFFTDRGRVSIWNERLNTWDQFNQPMENSWFACRPASAYGKRIPSRNAY